MRVVVDSMLRLPELPPRAAAVLRRRLSFPNPEYEACVRFGRHVGAIPEEVVLVERSTDGGLVVPRGAVGAVRQALAICGRRAEFVDHRVLLSPIDLSLRLELRDYQERAVVALARRVQGCAVLPCGAGKTVVGAGVIARLQQPALVLVHTRDLLAQWRERLREALGIEAGTVGEGVCEPAEVTVATVQTLTGMAPPDLAVLGQRFGAVLVDECVPGAARVVTPEGIRRVDELFHLQDSQARLPDVLSFSHERGLAECRPIRRVVRRTVRRRMVSIEVRYERKRRRLRVTEDHPVYVVGRGYVPAIQIGPRDKVLVSRAFYPCPECDAAFTSAGAVGGHVVNAHREVSGIKKLTAPGGACRHCGRQFSNWGQLRTHELRHEDPAFDERCRTWRSRRMRKTNLARRDQLRARMQSDNPMFDPAIRTKLREWHKHQPRESYRHLNGGNGKPPTEPERLLLDRLAGEWTWQHVVRTRQPSGSGFPRHYKIDLALPDELLAVEVDGMSHRSRAVQRADARKERLLRSMGWTVLRFRNDEVLADPDRVLCQIEEARNG